MPLLERSNAYKLEKLQEEHKNWTAKKHFIDEEDYHDWIEEGIDIFEQLVRLNREHVAYHVELADLYLQGGKDEKIRAGYKHEANKVLRRAMRFSPDNPDPYYHLSFLMPDFGLNEARWESTLFYAREALEHNPSQGRKIKLLCNMALAYKNLKLNMKAHEFLDDASRLDARNDYRWFIDLYTNKVKNGGKGRVLLKSPKKERMEISKRDYNRIKGEAVEGKCMVLDLSQREKYFHAKHMSVRLERREAEILAYLMDHSTQACNRTDIERVVWISGKPEETAVKWYISTIRSKLKKAMGRTDIAENVLFSQENNYTWQLNENHYVFR